MNTMKARWLTALAMLAGLPALIFLPPQPEAAEATDRVSGLARNGDWQLVQANCTECHSSALIIQNSGNRAVWQSRLVWMEQTQGMTALNPETEDRILSYLTENYGPRQSTRRMPLPSHLLPANPYPTL
ncbi:MAG: hypothetical protein OXE80_03490 [Gammaproteobacteria bacterium]|nr:hypothetical protein [Gammaproteobacteria bacterium]